MKLIEIANKKYNNKWFSILGDSISTLEGFNPKDYNVFYKSQKCDESGVRDFKNTWWGQVIEYFGGHLLVNNSWSGSRVTRLPNREKIFPSGCSDERTSGLHINSIMPDVIIVYLGTNDWVNHVAVDLLDCVLVGMEYESFSSAYDIMIKKIKANYPKSEVWCCTLCETFISKKPGFKFPHKYAGVHIEEYNDVIRNIVKYNECKLIDLFECKTAYDSIDGSHPNAEGMKTLAQLVISEIKANKNS